MAKIVVGIDEVGRGPWAGPVVSSAVALPQDCKIEGINDSKILNKTKREGLIIPIKQIALGIGIGWVGSDQIDKLGLSAAVELSMNRALKQVTCNYDQIIIDGNINFIKTNKSRAVVKADQKYVAVSAASVIAKVARDSYMLQMSKVHPGYGFEQHVGYGTKLHVASLANLGVSPIHRTSFAPVTKALAAEQGVYG